MSKFIQGLVAGVVQKKLVESLANNKQFQRMSLQFRDKVEELTGNSSPRKNLNNHNYSNTRQQQHNSNSKHHYNHSGASSKMFNSTNNNNNNTVRYTNDIYENQRIYEQQQRLKNQQPNSYNNNNNNNNNYQQQEEEKSFFSHLFGGLRDEFNSEINRVKNGGKITDIPDETKNNNKK